MTVRIFLYLTKATVSTGVCHLRKVRTCAFTFWNREYCAVHFITFAPSFINMVSYECRKKSFTRCRFNY